MNEKYASCSICGHRSSGWTYTEATRGHVVHMAEEHPEIKLGRVIGVGEDL